MSKELEEKENDKTPDENKPIVIGEDENDGSKNKNVDDIDTERTFSQAEVNRMMTKEKKQGRSSAFRTLGIDPDDQETIDNVIAYIREKSGEKKIPDPAGETNKDDVKSIVSVDENVIKAFEEKLKQYEARTKDAETKAATMLYGVKREFIEDAMVLAKAKLDSDIEGKLDYNGALAEVKAKYPVWFGGDDSSSGTGVSLSLKDLEPKKDDSSSVGARLATTRRGSKTPQSSFWKS